MRILVFASALCLVVAGAAAWVVEAEPAWYLRTRYPLEYEQVIQSYATERRLDPTLVAGRAVWCQYWSRDAGMPSGTGLTDGLTFVICD